jgi:lipopolysaccharide/colanic/teichoic acid biosynthesis glycosyltransferase
MRLRSPTSKSNFNLKLSPFDIFWAAAAPFVALALRDPVLLDLPSFPRELPPTYQYVLVTIACSILAFLLFKVNDGMTHFFSVHDVLAVCGAVAVTVVSSSAILFFLTRMDGVPRSTPLIYGLVLGSGMIIARTVVRAFHKEAPAQRGSIGLNSTSRNLRRVLLIGVDRFSAATIKLTDHQHPRTVQVIAALDAREAMLGRSISGVKIVGRVQDLGAVVDEYAVHGVDVDEAWLSDDAAFLTDRDVVELARRCAERDIKFARISVALNLTPRAAPSSFATQDDAGPAFAVNNYFKLKRVIDVVASAALLVALLPLATIAASLVLFDVGVPVLFWQQRIGQHGRKFLLYKFRTYHAPFDKNGTRTPEERRLSRLGRAIRAGRLDEIPQLLNVLVGDMSLIGPRPLLPVDQPSDPRSRLSVRPGITGWAQINGGTMVTPAEKDALDVWYVRHASFWLDLRIAVSTALFALSGERMNHTALAQAMRWRENDPVSRGAARASAELEDNAPTAAEVRRASPPGARIS